MGGLFFFIGYVVALWLAWSAGALAQRRRGYGRVRQHVFGLLHGTWFSTIVGLLLVPPAHWIGYLIAGVILLMAVTGRYNLMKGLPFWTRNPSNLTDIAPQESAKSGTSPQTPKPDKHQVSKARAMHDKAAAEMARKRAAWEAEHKRKSKQAPGNTLQQMCRDMTADGSLDVEEIADLWQWTKDHQEAVASGLPRVLADRLDAAWLDGIISNGEAFELFDLVSAVACGLSVSDYEQLSPVADAANSPIAIPASKTVRTTQNEKRVGRRCKLDTIHFTYETADGDVMERHVVVQAVDGIYIDGFCLMRQAVRTFRLDRIVSKVTSENTGEVLASADWAAEFSNPPFPTSTESSFSGVDLAYGEVLFTGFSAAERNRLECLAMSIGMVVRKSVTQNLDYLVAGPRAGPAKIAQAQLRSVKVLTADEFEQQRTGYITDSHSN